MLRVEYRSHDSAFLGYGIRKEKTICFYHEPVFQLDYETSENGYITFMLLYLYF